VLGAEHIDSGEERPFSEKNNTKQTHGDGVSQQPSDPQLSVQFIRLDPYNMSEAASYEDSRLTHRDGLSVLS